MDYPTPNRSDFDEAAIADLVRGLDNLRWSLNVQTDILALGPRAVAALVAFLTGPLTVNARADALAVLIRLREPILC